MKWVGLTAFQSNAIVRARGVKPLGADRDNLL